SVARLLVALLCASGSSSRGSELIENIAFGSCLNRTEHPMLDRTLTLPMQIFIFMGDNIYGDSTDMAVLRQKYDALETSAFFQKLKTQAHVLATWDDHDYGANDAGAEYPKRWESREEFFRWIDEPVASARREREGVYDARIFGPEGKRVQVILLDTRFSRSPLRQVSKGEQPLLGGRYLPSTDRSATMLGEAQWRWLEDELRKPAEVRLMVSSIQFVSEFSGAEAWANLPHEKERMLALIAQTKARGVVFLSGDRHWCELSRMEGPAGRPLYDLTASAMTVPHKRGTPTENKFRALPLTYHDVNVGHLHIDWAQTDPVLTLKIIDVSGVARLEHRVQLSGL
ncbi:MAG TPA: alkaline phosphatase D family protein, partial [Fimbriimonadaceae bacterium]|nr:alkaline phosphatase D family protein [Fimbriimonadaceae bacterium]